MQAKTTPAFGCVLASWTDGLRVHPDIILQGESAGTYDTIAVDQYEVHPTRGAVVRKPYDASGNAVDWSGYAAFRASYALYDVSTNSATYVTNQAQTVDYQDFGIAPFDPVTGQLNESTQAANKYLAGDYLSLGDVGTRPYDSASGTGIWADKTGIYGNLAGTPQFYLLTADGKAYAGAGAVTIDVNGLSMPPDGSTWFGWTSGGNFNSVLYATEDANYHNLFVHANLNHIKGRGLLQLAADNAAESLYIRLDAAAASYYASLNASGSNSARFGINESSPTEELHVVGDGLFTGTVTAQGAFTSPGIDDNANAVGITLDSTERVILTGTGSINHAGMNTILQGYSIATTAAAVAGASFGQFSADTRGSQINLSKSRNTAIALGAAVASGDTLGQILFTGDDGDSFDTGATIRAIVDGTPGNGDMPTRLEFLTSADGSATPTLRLTINSAGLATFANAVTVSGATTLSSTLAANGTVTMGDGINIVLNTGTGTKIGTGTTQKLGFFNATPVVQQGATTDLGTVLSNLGLRASGTAYPITTSGAVNFTGNLGVANQVTIDQGTNDTKILILNSTGDVAHNMTDHADTVTFFAISKVDGASGGADLYGYKDADGTAGNAIRVRGFLGETADTTKSVNALGVVAIDAAISDGLGDVAGVNANGNLVVFRSMTNTRALIDDEGDLHLDATSNINAWDEYDDLALIEAYRVLTANPNFKRQFALDMNEHAEILAKTGVLTLNADGHHFVSYKALMGLTLDALRQLGGRIKRLEQDTQ